MQINRITSGIYQPKQNINNNSGKTAQSYTEKDFTPVKYPYGASYVSFKAGANKAPKKVDVNIETQKLLKQFDEILASDLEPEDFLRLYERQVLSQMIQKKNKAQRLLNEATAIAESKHLTDLQKAEKMQSLQKEFNTLEKNMFKLKPFVMPKPVAPELDNALIRRFQTAIKEGNFNLDKVYQDYYSELADIKTVKELNEKYPKIDTPSEAAFVIADKITDTLTRDFFEELDNLMKTKDEQKIYVFITSEIKEIINNSTKNPRMVYNLVAIPSSMRILDKYVNLRDSDSFSSVPQFRKNKVIKISDNDLKLLSVDYDDFVLFVIREQYLNNKKPNEIKYTGKDVTIPVSSLKESYYKFDKTSEKVKSMINSAKLIQTAKRDYEHFDNEKLKECLSRQASSEAGKNDEIFERIVAFDACNFEDKDKIALIRFLHLLDSLQDKDITTEEVLDIIKKENLRPVETERLNALEKARVVQELKQQQKKNLELNYIKSEFDNAMNILYRNQLGSLAAACTKYRPEDTTPETMEKAKFITDLISRIDTIGQTAVKNTFKNWDTYNYYKETDSQNIMLKQAENYARSTDGTVDINKAGIYLDSAGIILNVPQSLEYTPDKEIVSGIIEKSYSQEKAIEYLSKYKEYDQLDASQKSHLLSFIDKFSPKDTVDKFILKNIIENDYINTDTVSKTKLNENDSVDVTITSSAKQQIYDKYMFPRCVDFMTDFEKAMTTVASERGSSGIKRVTKNNKAIEYKMELKLINHDDRLFASQKDYYFDVFSDKGLH